jgi:hypothetical protein
MSNTVAKINLQNGPGSALRRLSQQAQLTLIRAGESGSWVDGRWVDGFSDGVQFTGVCQAYTDEKEELPEASRMKRLIKVWSTSELRPLRRENGKPGDIIVWNGVAYEVSLFWDRSNDGNYWTAVGTAVDQ